MGNIKFAGLWSAVPFVSSDAWDRGASVSASQLWWRTSRLTHGTQEAEREYVDVQIAYPSHGSTPPRPPLRSTAACRHVPLPAEVILYILELASTTATLQVDTSALLAASLVCRSWSVPGQSLLFRHIDLRSQPSYAAFAAAVSPATPRGRALAQGIRSMRAVLDPAQPLYLRARSFAHAVTLCPKLRAIELSCYGTPPPPATKACDARTFFDEQALAYLRAGPAVSSLRFANWSSDTDALPSLLAVYPALHTLSVRGAADVIAAPLPALHAPALHVALEPPLAPALLDWLATGPPVRSIDFTRQPSPELLERVLKVHGPTLAGLALPSLFPATRALVRAHCPRLAALRVEHAWTSASVFADAPDALRHVAFGTDLETSLAPVLAFVRAHPGVERVQMMLWKRSPGERDCHPQLEELRALCAERGIEFGVDTDVRAFRAVAASPSFFHL
ncbi:hypothetical protein BV25DRAFT_1835684 [Artomyces pyxidatus]|uniref:Uncharacterized protein n=1 Tax=Artomyces pyxidatus TaxID=48021 RepID=A0ACB8TE40_9AGAM|nr:hypothetical protein BV25DRAFT_1835684 [Artomyces pyxidatus]